MIMPRYAASTDANHAQITKELRDAGFAVITIREPTDILVGHRAMNFLFEIKPAGGKVKTKKQKDFIAEWPGQVRIIETAEEAIETMNKAYGGW